MSNYKWTDQQELIFESVVAAKHSVLAIAAVAGAAKSSSLVESVKRAVAVHPDLDIMYMVFGALAAQEAKEAFGTLCHTTTLHAYAYKHTVNQYGLNKNIAPFLTWRDIPKSIKRPFGVDGLAMDYIERYCSSGCLDFKDYKAVLEMELEEGMNFYAYKLASSLLDAMANGAMRITHSFYLKLFHILVMNGTIKLRALDKLLLDECLDGDSRVKVEGNNRTIKIKTLTTMAEKGEPLPKAKSFNTTTKEFEYKQITDAKMMGVRQTYAVVTEGLSKVICTDNHKLYTQRGKVEVKDIVIGQDYLIQDNTSNQKCKYIPSEKQVQMILGSYLGDGGLVKESIFNTYRLNFTHGVKQLDYMKEKMRAFPAATIRNIKSGYTGQMSIYQSNPSKVFLLNGDPFQLVLDTLDARGLAIWLMDDGSVSNVSFVITIHSNSFSYEQHEQFVQMLQGRFGLVAKIHKSREYFQLSFSKVESEKLQAIVKPYLHKYFTKFRASSDTNYDWSSTYESFGGNFVKSITAHKVEPTYDITVEDNHNFLTSRNGLDVGSGVLVSNCQDLSAIALDVVSKIPTKQLILTGDREQRIFEFLKLEDGFLRYPNAKQLTLSKSFRVDNKYAPSIDYFLKTYLGTTSTFVGMDYPVDKPIVTRAYLTRTNAAVIGKMILLNRSNTPYHLATATKVRQIFKWPLALAYAKAGAKQKDPELQGFQTDVDEHSKLNGTTSLYQYLEEHTAIQPALRQAMNLLLKFGKQDIIQASIDADKHKKTACNLTIMNVFSSKGTTRDEVELDDDINMAVAKVLAKPRAERTSEDLVELKIGYVSCTRMRYSLINCKFLD